MPDIDKMVVQMRTAAETYLSHWDLVLVPWADALASEHATLEAERRRTEALEQVLRYVREELNDGEHFILLDAIDATFASQPGAKETP